MVLSGLATFLWWARVHSLVEAEREARLVYRGSTKARAGDVANCLDRELGLHPRGWEGTTLRTNWHAVWKVKVQIASLPHATEVSISTPQGRPLRSREQHAVSTCL